VLSPDPDRVSDDRWLHQVLDRGAFVYDPTLTWRSARALFDAGEIDVPQGLPALIDAVEGDTPLPLPEPLRTAEFRREGQDIVERQMALTVLVDATQGIDQDTMQKVWDDESFPTRLGVPQTTLALARLGADGLEPLAQDGPDPWALSELQLSAARFDPNQLDQTDPLVQAVKRNWTEARAQKTWIAVLGSDGRICDGLRYDPDLGAVWD
jgi:CRISPR-associated endonuclease/helicase Cas3